MESSVGDASGRVDILYELHRRGLEHLLHSVILYLDRPALFAAESTCKLWRDIIANKYFWKKILEQQMNTSRRWQQVIAARDCREEMVEFLNGPIPRTNRYAYRYLYSAIHLDLEKLERNWEDDIVPLKCIETSENYRGIRCLLHDHKFIACAKQNVIGIYSRQGSECALLDKHTSLVTCIDWFENILASGSSDTKIIIWCLKEYKSLATLCHHYGEIRSVVFHGYKLASCATDGNVIIRNVIDPLRVQTLLSISRDIELGNINCIEFDDKFVVSGNEDATIQVWSAESGKLIRTLNEHSLSVTCLFYAYPLIASGGKDRVIRVWNIDSGTCICFLEGHSAPIFCVKFDDKRLITCSRDKTFKTWKLPRDFHHLHPTVQRSTDKIPCVGNMPCLSINEFSIAFGSLDSNTITVYDFLDKIDKSYVRMVEELLIRRLHLILNNANIS